MKPPNQAMQPTGTAVAVSRGRKVLPAALAVSLVFGEENSRAGFDKRWSAG